MSRTVYSTFRGLRFRYRGRDKWECTRCHLVVSMNGVKHVCIPGLDRWSGLRESYDPNRLTYEQYESLSLLFAKLADERAEEERRWTAKDGTP